MSMQRPPGLSQPPPPPPRERKTRASRPSRSAPTVDRRPEPLEQSRPRLDRHPEAVPSTRPEGAWGLRRKVWAAARARRRVERAEVRRFTRRSRRRRTGLLVTGGLVVVLAGSILIAAYSPLLAIRTIRVEGASSISPDAVAAALHSQLGVPLPLLDSAAVSRSLAKFPVIGSYVTESRPPDTLVVRIVERTPMAVVRTEQGFDLVDAAGVTLATTSKRPDDYPVLSVEDGADSGRALEAAAAVLAALPTDVLTGLDKISASTANDVTLVLAEGQRVLWGSAEDSDRKSANLELLLLQKPKKAFEYDVSSPDVGIIR